MSLHNAELVMLDRSDPAQIAAFERGFHAAFSRVPSNRLVRTLWEWDDDTRRLRTRIPYDEQEIFALFRPDREVCLGMAVNRALRSFQSSAFGFAVPADSPPACELLALYIEPDPVLAPQFGRMTRTCFAQLAASGLAVAYATTATRVLPLYRRLGAKIIESRTIGTEERHFLCFDLSK